MVPAHPLINGKQGQELDLLILKALSIKFNFTSQHFDRINNLPYNDDSYIISTFAELPNYTALCYFSYLPDLSARGYCRRVCLCFLSTSQQKIMRNYNQIVAGFSQCMHILKKEAVEYSQRLTYSIKLIEKEIQQLQANLNTENTDTFKQILHTYNTEYLEKLKQQLLKQRATLLNHHTLLHYEQQPVFLQLFQSEELNDIKFRYEAEYLVLNDKQLENQKIFSQQSIIPDDYIQKFVTVAPHELRIVKRQELRSIDKLTTQNIYQYFLTIVRKMYNYYSKSLVDIELSQRNRCMQGQSLYFGKLIKIQTELNKDIKFNDIILNNTFLTSQIQKMVNINLNSVLQAEKFQQNSVKILKTKQNQLIAKFEIDDQEHIEINDYPYLLTTKGYRIIDELEQYGQLFTLLRIILGNQIFYSLINTVLINQQINIVVDDELVAYILQQVLYLFCIQKTENQLHILIEESNWQQIQLELAQYPDIPVVVKIFLVKQKLELDKQQMKKFEQKIKSIKTDYIIISTQTKKIWMNTDKNTEKSTLTQDCEQGYKNQQFDSYQSLCQRIEINLKQYAFNALYDQIKVMEGCDQQIYKRIKDLLKNKSDDDVYTINQSNKKMVVVQEYYNEFFTTLLKIKPQTCKQAIQNLLKEQNLETPQEIVDAPLFYLYIEKMDQSLQELTNCKKLSLSSNKIDRIQNLNGLKLEILSIGRNNIRKLDGLEPLQNTLKQLWISYNQIEKIEKLSQFQHIEKLFMANNQIQEWSEIDKLQQLKNLNEVVFVGNPLPNYSQQAVLQHLPQVQRVDGYDREQIQ